MYFYHIKQEYSTEQLLTFYWQGTCFRALRYVRKLTS